MSWHNENVTIMYYQLHTNWGDDQFVFLSFSDGINSGAVSSSSPEASFEAFEAKEGAVDFVGWFEFPPIDLWIKKFLESMLVGVVLQFTLLDLEL